MDDTILFHVRYSTEGEFLAQALEAVAKQVRKARTGSDLKAAQAQLLMVNSALSDCENRWKRALLKFAAGDQAKECAFHSYDYRKECRACPSSTELAEAA